MSELEVQGLVKRFGDNAVVDNVSFRVQDNEFFVLLGPSGSGKTTLLRLICGLETPDVGSVLLNGQDITRLPPRNRNLGVVFQDYGLYPHMDVYGNIAYGLEARGMPQSEIDMRVVHAANVLGIESMLKKMVLNLSGGEQQRVALARALVKNADAYIFDEPLSDLDARMRYQLRKEIILVHRIKQKPTIYVTHDQAEAFSMAQHVGVIANGRMQQIGTPDELLHTPANTFMARFMGSPPMNILYGYLQRVDMRYRVLAGSMYLILPPRWTRVLAYYKRPDVLVGIRPNTILPIWSFGNLYEQPRYTSRAEIIEAEPLVGETIVRLKIGATTELMAVIDTTNGFDVDAGQMIQVGVDTEQVVLFDPRTEQAIRPI